MIGVSGLVFGTVGACIIAGLRRIAVADALLACLHWQGTSTAIALCVLAFQ